MNSPIRFDLWQKRRPVVETKKNRKSLTIEAFSATCGYVRTSVSMVRAASFASPTGIVNPVTTAGTLEAFVYPTRKDTSGYTNNRLIFGEQKGNGSVFRFNLALNYLTDTLGCYFDNTFVDSEIPVSHYVWSHVAVSWDGTNARFFINGVFVATKPYAGPITAGEKRVVNGRSSDTTFQFNGYVSELRVWDIAVPDYLIEARFNKRRSNGDTSLDPNLRSYFPCRETAPAIGDLGDRVDTAHDMLSVLGTTVNSYDIYPPIRFGSSFVAAQWDVTLDNRTSLVYPVEAPDSVNFMLIVRWEDEDGTVQRRKFWDMAGVDIAPEVVSYAGEKLPLIFTLEAWNIDGEETATLNDDLVLYTGETSLPTIDGDHTSQSADDLAVNTLLAADLTAPGNLPLVFNQQQTYP